MGVLNPAGRPRSWMRWINSWEKYVDDTARASFILGTCCFRPQCMQGTRISLFWLGNRLFGKIKTQNEIPDKLGGKTCFRRIQTLHCLPLPVSVLAPECSFLSLHKPRRMCKCASEPSTVLQGRTKKTFFCVPNQGFTNCFSGMRSTNSRPLPNHKREVNTGAPRILEGPFQPTFSGRCHSPCRRTSKFCPGWRGGETTHNFKSVLGWDPRK